MAPYSGRRIFRSSPWLLVLLGAAELLFLAGAWFSTDMMGQP